MVLKRFSFSVKPSPCLPGHITYTLGGGGNISAHLVLSLLLLFRPYLCGPPQIFPYVIRRSVTPIVGTTDLKKNIVLVLY